MTLIYAAIVLQQARPSTPAWLFPLQILLIVAIFYFLMIRPQQKQRRTQEAMLTALKKGDEIVTAGGIVGKVVHIRESMKDGAPVVSMDDRITIESGEARLIVERGRIARVAGTATGAKA
jgi:preprotein translocase subunit YajC